MNRTGTANLDGGAPVTPAPAPAPAPPVPQPEPVDGPIAPFVPEVQRLYLGYFLRPADDDGLVYWTGQRQAGLTLARISEEFALSTEFQNRYGQADNAAFVDLVYLNVLNRQPDAEGRTYWITQLDQGMTRGELMTGFTESAEFVRTYTTRL